MRFSLLLGTFAALVHSHVVPTSRAAKAPYFILTGDSTTAVNGGWGPGLLPLAQSGAGGVNHAKGGATTVSFRNGGYWDSALKSIASSKANYEPVVTIQFGHNDQKAEAGISVAQFQANLEKMAREVISAGGTPIILTSLTRRTFSGGKVVENLKEHSAAAIAAARNVGIKFLELNQASTNYINAIGASNADYYNLAQGDRTHLNVAGEKVFGRMVADLIAKGRTDLKTYLKQNQALSDKIAAGQFATGSETGGGTTPPPTGSCSALWAQCGGSGWAGATCCASGACKAQNEWYSQCQ